MVEIKSGLNRLVDKGRWADRGGSFVAKVKATKAVWFPPKAPETGKQAVSTAKKTATKTAKKTAKRPPTGKTTAAARKTTSRRNVSTPVRRTKT
jgi:hypothetical protein